MSVLLVLFIVPFIASVAAFACYSISGKILKRLFFALSLLPLLILLFHPSSMIGEHIQYDWLPALSIQLNSTDYENPSYYT